MPYFVGKAPKRNYTHLINTQTNKTNKANNQKPHMLNIKCLPLLKFY